MANYKDIVGTAVRNNAGNIPTAETGQVFFDSTNLDFKYQFPNTLSSWRTGNNLNTARDQTSGAGTQDSSVVFGGGPPVIALNESYDGTSWTETTDINTARRSLGGSSGAGSVTATLVFGGLATPSQIANTEAWNGSSWT